MTTWVVEYEKDDGELYGDDIEAETAEDALSEAIGRHGITARVCGELKFTIPADQMTEAQADAMIRRLNRRDNPDRSAD